MKRRQLFCPRCGSENIIIMTNNKAWAEGKPAEGDCSNCGHKWKEAPNE